MRGLRRPVKRPAEGAGQGVVNERRGGEFRESGSRRAGTRSWQAPGLGKILHASRCMSAHGVGDIVQLDGPGRHARRESRQRADSIELVGRWSTRRAGSLLGLNLRARAARIKASVQVGDGVRHLQV